MRKDVFTVWVNDSRGTSRNLLRGQVRARFPQLYFVVAILFALVFFIIQILNKSLLTIRPLCQRPLPLGFKEFANRL